VENQAPAFTLTNGRTTVFDLDVVVDDKRLPVTMEILVRGKMIAVMVLVDIEHARKDNHKEHVFSSVAYCHPADKWDPEFGARLALSRALQLDSYSGKTRIGKLKKAIHSALRAVLRVHFQYFSLGELTRSTYGGG